MFISEGSQITRKEAHSFLEPANATHRQYEALRAFFVEGLSAAQVAQRYGYSPGTVRVMVHQFRQTPERPFFLPPAKGPQAAPKSDPLRDRIVALRKQNLSIYDISRALAQEGHPLSAVAVSQVLRQEGFARLPRRSEEERPSAVRPTVAAVADVRQLDWQPRTLRTQLGGLFLFVPLLAQIPWERICSQAKLPGSKMIPASCALRSLLGLKLFGTARHAHVMSAVLDEGLALFAGLNVIPKRSFLTEYSCRIDPACYGRWMHRWFDAVSTLGLTRGESFDLDFHTIPFHGEDALLQKHYVTKRSRRQKGIWAFLAQDDRARVFCYAKGQWRKEQQNDEILRFVAFWKQRTGRYPEELIFDSKLTTYTNLSRLNDWGIRFITLRRRSPKLLRQITTTPASAWRRIELEGVSRLYKTPRILDRKITLSGYEGLLRQMTILDLGHEEPTLLLTNQLTRSPAPLIERYARRMLIENQIADGIDFFHMDALSSAVAMKVNCDLQLTLMAGSLYRLLGVRIGHGYETAKSRHLFRDFINATATIRLTDQDLQVTFAKRAHNPLLLAAGLDQTEVPVPWLGNRRLKLVFG
jgi:transposase